MRQKYLVVNGVRCLRKVWGVSQTSVHWQKIMCQWQQRSSFSAMTWPESILCQIWDTSFKEVIFSSSLASLLRNRICKVKTILSRMGFFLAGQTIKCLKMEGKIPSPNGTLSMLVWIGTSCSGLLKGQMLVLILWKDFFPLEWWHQFLFSK